MKARGRERIELGHIEETDVYAHVRASCPSRVQLGFKPAQHPSIHQASPPSFRLAMHRDMGRIGGRGTFGLASQLICGPPAAWGRRFEVLRQSEMPSFQRLPQNACSRLWRSCAWSEERRKEPTDGPFRSANVTIGPNNCPMPEWLSRARPWFVPARHRSPANHWADLKCGPMT